MDFLYNISDDLVLIEGSEFRVLSTRINAQKGFYEIDVFLDGRFSEELDNYETFEDAKINGEHFGERDAKIIGVNKSDYQGNELTSIRMRIMQPVELKAI